MEAKTQKAKGIQKLSTMAHYIGTGIDSSTAHIYPAVLLDSQDKAEIAIRRYSGSFGGSDLFVRPCPMRPRHGFVDSRKIKAKFSYESAVNAGKELLGIVKEVLAADPDGEIVLAPYIRAECNSIITPSGITIGPGNDGATAGRNSITLPIPSPKLEQYLRKDSERYGVLPTESPYLEFVDGPEQGAAYLTQIRAGPNIEITDDYIPYEVKVGKVITIEADYDLLQWESDAVTYGSVRNLVVYHRGGSINSHFGVHCVINKIPYVTTREPKIGDIIIKNTQVEWQPEDYKYVAELARKYDSLDHNSLFTHTYAKYASFVLGGLHAVGSLMQSRSEYAFRIVAASMVAGARLFNAVATGELRHAPSNTSADSPAKVFFKLANLDKLALGSSRDRDMVYKYTMNDDCFMEAAAKRALGAYYCYTQPEWADSYGGQSWAECASSSFMYSRKLAQFITNPSREKLNNVLNEFNKLVNLVHNNGWWLNKVMSQNELNRCSRTPATSFVNHISYRIITAILPDKANDVDDYGYWMLEANKKEAEYRNIIRNMPDYVAGVEGRDEENPFESTAVPVKMDSANCALDFPLAPAKLTEKGNLTVSEFRSQANRPFTYNIASNAWLLWRFLDNLLGPKKSSQRIYVGTVNQGKKFLIVIPNDGQESLKAFALAHPGHMKRAWNEKMNAFVFMAWVPYDLRALKQWYMGHTIAYRTQYKYHPKADKEVSINGTETWSSGFQEVVKKLKGFKLLPPIINTDSAIPRLAYLKLQWKTYKQTGVYNAEACGE